MNITKTGYRLKGMVIFYDPARYPFYDCFQEGFRHVMFWQEVEYGYLKIQPNRSSLQITHTDCTEPLAIYPCCTVVHVDKIIDTTPKSIFKVFTCTEVIKNLLGIERIIYTPFQLFNYIRGESWAVVAEH